MRWLLLGLAVVAGAATVGLTAGSGAAVVLLLLAWATALVTVRGRLARPTPAPRLSRRSARSAPAEDPFMADPVAGLREMARVTKVGGVVAACVWDNAGGSGPLSPLWRVAQRLDPTARDESGAPGAREGQLAELARESGLARVDSSRLNVKVPFETFEEWWQPLNLGVGSGGAYVQRLEEAGREALRQRLEHELGPAPFTLSASAWCFRAVVADSS